MIPNPKSAVFALLTIVVLLSPRPALAQDNGPKITLKKVFANLKIKKPVAVVTPPDGSNRLFLVEQRGVISILPTDRSAGEATVFLDISSENLIDKDFEEGLLGLAFHPDFKNNKKFYIYHSQQDPKRSVISELLVGADGKGDRKSTRIIMELRQPYWNHNSGNILFGPDGYFYIAFGDGGKANDPHNLAQNLWALNGKIVRIDVNSRDGDLQYAIPKDNPFAKIKEGVRREIWSYGMRNPWGLSFDRQGRFWCADVGQGIWEEIDLIEKGGNYGWSHREGAHDFELKKDLPVPKGTKFIDPVHEYDHTKGISITGGHVYEGDRIPALKGHYIYADWAFGTTWALKVENGKKVANHTIYSRPKGKRYEGFKPTAFGYDTDGKELLLLSWDGIYEIHP